MSDQPASGEPPTDEAGALSSTLDQLCGDFEAAWKSGSRQPLEHFLDRVPQPQRQVCFRKLLLLEVALRRRAGDEPTPYEYAARFPNDRDTIEEVFVPDTGTVDGQPNVSSADPPTETYHPPRQRQVGRFGLVKVLGSGHFGEVWLARDPELDRLVAIKLMRAHEFDPADEERFLREARAAAQLRHPGIVGVHEVGSDGGRSYIVSDYICGLPLSKYLKTERPSPRRAAELCAAIGDALQHAHERGIIHRDLKPSNILLDEAGQPHVVDFGLARRETGEASLTIEGQLIGTPAYMAPEQARGQGHRADRRTDVYALGVTLYEMLAGRRPFEGDSQSVIYHVLTTEPPPPRKLQPEVPRDLETICLKAMAKDPRRRYPSAAEMSADLRSWLFGRPIRARRTGPIERGVLWTRRNWSLATAAALAGVALPFGGYAVWQRRREGPSPRTVILDTEPTGAQVLLYPLDPQDGSPQVADKIEAGTSPLEIDLLPGDYLVVAYTDEEHFHEVMRHVPSEEEKFTGNFAHASWTSTDAGLKVPRVRLHAQITVVSRMVRFSGSHQFALDFRESPNHHFDARIPPFHLDAAEVTFDQFTTTLEGTLPIYWWTRSDRMPPGETPVTQVTFHEALQYTEAAGLRLMHDAEYEFAATRGGTRKFPWGDSIDLDDPLCGPVKLDVADSDGRVARLYSGVLEWTETRPELFVTGVSGQPAEKGSISRRVRGGPPSILEGDPTVKDWSGGPRQHAVYIEKMSHSKLGFRCARSARPRKTADDFVAILPRQPVA